MLAAVIPIPVHLLVLGGGPDAVPLVHIARELGWYVTIGDHRRAYVERMRPIADAAIEVALAELKRSLDPNAYDAAVIMSHHLQSDRGYLRALASGRVPYVRTAGSLAHDANVCSTISATRRPPLRHGCTGRSASISARTRRKVLRSPSRRRSTWH